MYLVSCPTTRFKPMPIPIDAVALVTIHDHPSERRIVHHITCSSTQAQAEPRAFLHLRH